MGSVPLHLLAGYCFGPGIGLVLTAAGLGAKVFLGASEFGRTGQDAAEVIAGVLTNLSSNQLVRLPQSRRVAELDRAVVASMLIALNDIEQKYATRIAAPPR